MNPTFERALWASAPALRCLAPLDAILAPALGLYWVKTLPASGGLVGAVLGVFCLWIGARRAYRALFEFEAYRWMTLRFRCSSVRFQLRHFRCCPDLAWC